MAVANRDDTVMSTTNADENEVDADCARLRAASAYQWQKRNNTVLNMDVVAMHGIGQSNSYKAWRT